MLSMATFTTEKLIVNSSDKNFTLSAPDLFSSSLVGDVYLFDLSLEITTIDSDEECILNITIVNGYNENSLGCSQLINAGKKSGDSPVFIRFSPVIFTVKIDGTNPLDMGVVHMKMNLISGTETGLEITTKGVWQKVDRIDL